MKANDAWDSVPALVLTGMIDAGFVLIWIITQLLVNRFVFRTSLVETSLSGWLVLVLQLIFAISTLAPVALYLVRDVTIGIRRLAKT
jgi:hypothetical protein